MTDARTRLHVNGREVGVDAPEGTALISVLRDDLGLTGVRAGCAIGECGACTVVVDGDAVRSCTTPIDEVAGRQVTTPEGLGTPSAPHPIQRCFLERQAAQCGYCVNGMIMTVAALDRATVTADQVRDALDGHLCRCGTHVRLLAAASEAVGLGAERRTADHDVPVPDGASQPPPPPGELPPAVAAHPRIEQWVELGPDGRFVLHAGKVEIGQGIRTAFRQIVAAQIGVPPERVTVARTRTGASPDQWFTAGSLSVEDGGTALARAGAAIRRVLVERGAARLGVDPADVRVDGDGLTTREGGEVAFVDLAYDGAGTGVIRPDDVPRWDVDPVGSALPRDDLPAKLTGAPAFLHDRRTAGMLHARVVLPPTLDAALAAVDLDEARAADGVVEVVRDGRLLVVIADSERGAVRAAARLRRGARWEGVPTEGPGEVEGLLRSLPSEPFVVRHDDRAAEAIAGAPRSWSATYTTPYQGHGQVAPSVAVAEVDDGGHLTVWTHAQGIYPQRRELAALLGRAEDDLTVEHVDGPGVYGMTCADDAAGFAAVAAQAVPGRPVRLQLGVEDEFGWEPYGPAMVVDLSAGLGDDGRLRAWRYAGITDSHMTRPTGSGDRLVASWLRGDGRDRPWPGASEGGARNAAPFYDVPVLDVVSHHVRGPLRTAALRCLGAYANLFATESFVDELAELAGRDPVAFRLDHLTDGRARAVLEAAADRAGWREHVGPSGRGMGVSVAHYKDSKAYVAQVAEVEVDAERGAFRVVRITVVADAGLVINPDGLRNQLEGGTLQGLSRALFERVTPGPAGARERDWTTYPVLRFRDVPELDVAVLHRPDLPPLGVGESATPVVPAAVANAIDDAIGVRLRHLPLTTEQLERRLLEMDEAEAARVRL